MLLAFRTFGVWELKNWLFFFGTSGTYFMTILAGVRKIAVVVSSRVTPEQ